MSHATNHFSAAFYATIASSMLIAGVVLCAFYVNSSTEVDAVATSKNLATYNKTDNLRLPTKPGEDTASAAIRITTEIRKNRTMDTVTAGKLQSKVAEFIAKPSTHRTSYILTPKDVDTLVRSAYVYPEERDYWASYATSVGLI